MNEGCKGCLATDNKGSCSLGVFQFTDECPCMKCLVKVMCKENCGILIRILYGEEKDE